MAQGFFVFFGDKTLAAYVVSPKRRVIFFSSLLEFLKAWLPFLLRYHSRHDKGHGIFSNEERRREQGDGWKGENTHFSSSLSFDDLLFPLFTTCSYVGWLRRDRQLCRSPAAAELVCVCVYCASSSLHTHPRLLWRRLGFFSSFRGLERRGNSCAAAAAVSRRRRRLWSVGRAARQANIGSTPQSPLPPLPFCAQHFVRPGLFPLSPRKGWRRTRPKFESAFSPPKQRRFPISSSSSPLMIIFQGRERECRFLLLPLPYNARVEGRGGEGAKKPSRRKDPSSLFRIRREEKRDTATAKEGSKKEGSSRLLLPSRKAPLLPFVDGEKGRKKKKEILGTEWSPPPPARLRQRFCSFSRGGGEGREGRGGNGVGSAPLGKYAIVREGGDDCCTKGPGGLLVGGERWYGQGRDIGKKRRKKEERRAQK